jgi:hypothetical protein
MVTLSMVLHSWTGILGYGFQRAVVVCMSHESKAMTLHSLGLLVVVFVLVAVVCYRVLLYSVPRQVVKVTTLIIG